MADVDRIHTLSFENEQAVLSSKRCGCFYCLKFFDSSSIIEWVDDCNSRTAVCPFCGVDAVLPDSTVDLSAELLTRMSERWFT